MTSASITVALSDSFTQSTQGLTQSIGGKIWDTINKFQKNPDASGLNLEALSNGLMSIRVDQAYRIILSRFESGRSYVFLWADHHDSAYRWAENHRAELVNGLIQIYPHKLEQDARDTSNTDGIFSHVSDYDLEALNVPAELYKYVRSIKTNNDLNMADSILHPLVHEALTYLSSGIPVSEIVEVMNEQSGPTVDYDESESILNSPENRSSLLVFNHSHDLESFQNALNQPLSKWRHFLHPSQRHLVEKTYTGPTLVSGGPGTGKTVVALHRAKFLAENIYESTNDRLLLTTYNTNMANNISTQLQSICSAEALRKIDVSNVDQIAYRMFMKLYPHMKIVYDNNALKNMWSEAISNTELKLDFPIQFYMDEWAKIIQPQRVKNAQEYLGSNRLGRGTRLSRRQKVNCWKIFSAYLDICESMNCIDIERAYAVVTDQLRAGIVSPVYSSIIIDEAQDFDILKLSFIRSLAGPEHVNDLFIVGDERQRIYQENNQMRDSGITIDNRRYQLRVNYRTTEQIRRWANNLFRRSNVDTYDANLDIDSGHISLMGGPEPEVVHFSNVNEEIEYIDSILLKIVEDGGSVTSLNDVCLTFRTNRLLNNYKSQLQQRGYRTYELKGSTSEDTSHSGLRLATMHRVKGLEFDHMIVCATNADVIPNKATLDTAADAISRKILELNEKNLLFVAATRARLTLSVFSHGTPSIFLE